MTQKIQHQMTRLFGARTVRRAAVTEPSVIVGLGVALMAQVYEAADAVLARQSHIEDQIDHIKGLSPDVRLVLCMWLMETSIAVKLIRAVCVDGVGNR